MGLAQTDIKKVLAYSTVSQLGYMFLGCGVLAFSAGMFHVFTHAWFKACLFLGSGSVIHALGGEQDMTKMGGLRKLDPAHVRHDVRRDARDRGRAGPRGLLLEGRDPRARRSAPGTRSSGPSRSSRRG